MDPIVQEVPIEIFKSDLSLFAFPTKEKGDIAGFFLLHDESGKHCLMLKDHALPFIGEKTTSTVLVGTLSENSLRLVSVPNCFIAAPSVSRDDKDEWKSVSHRICSTEDLMNRNEPVVFSSAISSSSSGVSFDRFKAVSEFFAECAIANWCDIVEVCGGSSKSLLAATMRLARLVRGVWVRKVWGKRPSDENMWRFIVNAFVESESVKKSVLFQKLGPNADLNEAQIMLEAIAWRIGDSANTRAWVLKASPDLSLFVEFPECIEPASEETFDIAAVAAEVPVASAVARPPAEEKLIGLFEKHGLLSDIRFRAWAAEANVAEPLMMRFCHLHAEKNVWTLRRELMNRRDTQLGDYVFAAMQLLCRLPDGALVAKKSFVEAFAAAKLPEASENTYKKAVKMIAVADKTKWKLKTGEL